MRTWYMPSQTKTVHTIQWKGFG